MTQKPVFMEGIFTLRNLRSMGAAAIIEILIACGIAGVLIWQELRTPVTQPPPISVDPTPYVPVTPPLQRTDPVPQPPQHESFDQVPSIPTQLPGPTTQPVQEPPQPWLPGQQAQPEDLAAEFSSSMLRAINAQKIYPKIAMMRGDTGEAVVSFDYVDGVVSDIHVDRSSGSHDLDQAAIQAVQKAVLPPKPAELAGLDHFVFTLVFDLGG